MASPTPPPAASARVAVVAAEADGVSPSLLVTCATGAKRQYLFSCAEGFSRLALEHRARPSSKLRAVFLPSLHPRACGGLGGTLLRLCADGHERVHVVGPPGVGAHVDALRALVRFRHPDAPVLALVPPGGEPPGRDDPCDAAAEEYDHLPGASVSAIAETVGFDNLPDEVARALERPSVRRAVTRRRRFSVLHSRSLQGRSIRVNVGVEFKGVSWS